jgi:photosystem II stability/assembly factor-like uncharacterized protein
MAGPRVSWRMPPISRVLLFLALATLFAPAPGMAHDASAYGGLFRSRSMGGAWLNADVGLYLNAALTVAIDPLDPNHLLMGSDSGLWASVNGGRSWTQEAPDLIAGAVFAVAFSPDRAIVLCVAPSGVYRNLDGRWSRSDAPSGAAPGRGVVFGAAPGRVYLLGRERLFSSDDGGARFARVAGDLDDSADLETIAVLRQPSETLLAISHGRLLVSTNGGQRWRERRVGDTAEPVEAVIPDPAVAGRIWAAAANRLQVSSDGGVIWQALGNALPEVHTVVRGIAADPTSATLVVTTHRGTYRSTDAGVHWTLEEGNLPVHLEAGPLARDPENPSILYIVYSLIPYPEVWRSALEGSNLLARVDPMDLLGGLAFLLLLSAGSITLVVWLARQRRDVAGTAR